MSLVMPKKGGGNYELVAAGNYPATCYRVIDLGTHMEQFQAEDPQPKHKVMIVWELTDEKMSDGRPFSQSQEYNLSSHEKSTFRKHLESWRNKAFTDAELGTFEISRLLGVPCMLNIAHKPSKQGDRKFANITAVGSWPKSMRDDSGKPKVTPLVNEVLHLDLGNFDSTVYAKLPDWIKEKIAKSPEYQAISGHDPRNDDAPPSGEGPDAPF